MANENLIETLSVSQRSILMASNAMDSNLLITGETGTGKTRLAQLAHQLSPKRRLGKFHKVNLPVLSENLLESELFGHERGAFTGADLKRVGRFEICHGGTVFLDEIGEVSPRLQAKLLDFIQYKRFSPVGSNREVEVDVRIVAATNKDLKTSVEKGEFREDLYHRLNVFRIEMPSLRMRKDKILPLCKVLLEGICQRVGRDSMRIAKDAEQGLTEYPWPGNVRELENALEFAVGMEVSRELHWKSFPDAVTQRTNEEKVEGTIDLSEDFIADESVCEIFSDDSYVSAAKAVGALELPISLNFHETKNHFERTYLERMLRLCNGKINLTSKRIGLNKVSLAEKIKRHNIDWRRMQGLEQATIPDLMT